MSVVANIPADFNQVFEFEGDELLPTDQPLSADELAQIALFAHCKKAPDFDKYPGTTLLRFYPAGSVICRQGAPGASAYYLLTTDDVLALQTARLRQIDEALAANQRGAMPPGAASPPELQAQKTRLQAEVHRLAAQVAERQALAQADPQRAKDLCRAARVMLVADVSEERPRRGALGRLLAWIRAEESGAPAAADQAIPVDAPVNLSRNKLQDVLFEGEMFGEMSCFFRSPRSATVVAERDCYALKMLRNVVDMLNKDPQHKKRMDEVYRSRVLRSHIRRLSIFAELDDATFEALKPSFQLEMVESGGVIFEERDPSDAVYVVRSGLVKVIKNAGYTLREDEFHDRHWAALPAELAAAARSSQPLAAAFWQALPASVQPLAQEGAGAPQSAAGRGELLAGLNTLIRDGRLHLEKKLGQTRSALVGLLHDRQVEAALAAFPEEAVNWSEYERRLFHRYCLEALCPKGIPRRLAAQGASRTLAYVGRGEVLGEIGVLRNAPRSATCVAYDHPDGYLQRVPDSRTGATPSRVELVKIDRAALDEALARSGPLRARLEQILHSRLERDLDRQHDARGALEAISAPAGDFERLGLIQGQRLMLIDLARCTRCGACVEACVATHADGHARLHLDGPRFDRYLVPLSCRKCLDPVCMIGCPVGAINRGDNGEIRITNWCIGCKMCSEQCPYGSIQMQDLTANQRQELEHSARQLKASGADLKDVSLRAVVCDLCSSVPGRQPACVYSCPHDAALRVDARQFFLEGTDARAS